MASDDSAFPDVDRRVHRDWWTCVPTLPSDPAQQIWLDDTTLSSFRDTEDNRPPAFFDETCEDHQAAALFQTWAALLPMGAPPLLALLGALVSTEFAPS